MCVYEFCSQRYKNIILNEISPAISVNHVLAMHACLPARLLALYTGVGLKRYQIDTIRNLIRRWIRWCFRQEEKWYKCATAIDFVYYLLHLANRMVYTLLQNTIVEQSSASKFSQNLFPATTIATHMEGEGDSARTMNKQINKQTIAFSFAFSCCAPNNCSALLAYLWPF